MVSLEWSFLAMPRWPLDRILGPYPEVSREGEQGMTTRVTKIVDLSEKRREVRGHITETGEIIQFDRIREAGSDDDEGPRAA